MTPGGIALVLALVPATGPLEPPPPPPTDSAGILGAAMRVFLEGSGMRADADAARERFRAAARGHDELWRRGFRNPTLAFNRARCHRLAGNLPAALAAAHDGLAVARYDRPLQVALEEARAAVSYPLDGDLAARCRPKPTRTVGSRMSPVEAYALAAAGWVLAWLGAVRFAATRLPWYLVFAATWVTALGGLGGLWVQDWRRQAAETAHPFVIVAQEATLRKGNGESYPPRLETRLPRGAEARELARRGGWVQVELAGGDVGWLPEPSLFRES